MPQLRHTTLRRQFRLANLVLLVGMFAAGEFVLERLSDLLLRALATTTPGIEIQTWNERGALAFKSLTLGELSVAITGLVGVLGFSVIEWRRNRNIVLHERRCRQRKVHTEVHHLSVRERLNILFARGGGWSMALIVNFAAVQMYARSLGGGQFLETSVSGWDRLAILAVLVSLALVVGLMVAAVSMMGLRLIRELRQMAERVQRNVRHVKITVRAVLGQRVHTVRERFGDTLLSRPPPCVAV